MKTTLLACVCALFSAGCASTWQYVKFPDQNKKIEDVSKARIYVIRSAQPPGRAHVDVIDGKQLVGSTGPNGYLCWERKPGETMITSSSKGNSRVTLDAAAGQVYYLLQKVDPGSVYARTSLEVVPAETAQPVLANSKPPVVRRLPSSFDESEPPTAAMIVGPSTSRTAFFVSGQAGGHSGGRVIIYQYH